MPRRDITFDIIRLLSQQIVSDNNKYPEGQLIQKTSCMNPEDGETIGILEACKVFLKEDKEALELFNLLEDFFEKVGVARWVKGELTHLGFRAGLKYHETVDLSEEGINEVDMSEE